MSAQRETPGETASGCGERGRPRRPALRGRDIRWLIAVPLLGALALGLLVSGCGEDSDNAGQAGAPGAAVAIAAPDTITVVGKATVGSVPDEAVLTLSVESDGTEPGESVNTNSAAIERVMARLKAEGVESSAIETANVTVYPIRNYNPQTGEETLTGYRSQNSITVTLSDAEMVGKVLAAAIETGVTNVSGLVWRLSDDTAPAAEALKQAVANARTKAEALAEAQGVKVGDVMMMSEGSTDQSYVPYYAEMYGMAAGEGADREVAPAPISAASLDVTASVTVTYSLER